MTRYALCFVVLQLLFGGLASAQNVDTGPKQTASGDYVIRAGDVLDVHVDKQKVWTKSYTVSPNGAIVVPLVGEVKAAGLTQEELQKQLTSALAKLVRNPIVTVRLSRGSTSPAAHE